MKFRFISYGIKYYEEIGEAAPRHDFLFNLRDLNNPFWIPELKGLHGLEPEIRDFFAKDDNIQNRLDKIADLVKDFIEDALNNSHRSNVESITFAFRCTGGKHRSVYFAQSVFEKVQQIFEDREAGFEVEHVDLHRYLDLSS